MKLVHGRKVKILTPGGTMLIVDIYPVGIFDEVRNSWRTKSYKMHFRIMFRLIRKGYWRALRNHFNGYLAEPDVMPGRLTRCGSGWTRKRALRDLRRRVKRKCV